MMTWVELFAAAALAYVSTNVDGYALLLGFFSDARYRTMEIVAGQFASFAIQLVLSASVVALVFAKGAAWVGLFGLVPLSLGIMRIARLRVRAAVAADEAGARLPSARGGDALGRMVTVAVAATSCATDNVLAYSVIFAKRTPSDVISLAAVLTCLTLLMCLGAFAFMRSNMTIHAVRRVIAPLSPFVTAGIGVALLARFDTLPWLCSLVRI